MENVTSNGVKLNQLEYGYLVEDTDPCARTMKVECPKLTATLAGGGDTHKGSINNSKFANSGDCSVGSGSTSTEGNYITAKVCLEVAHRHSFHDCPGCPCPNATHDAITCHPGTSHLVRCDHYHHDHHFPHLGETGMIPAGTKVILLFMDNNPKDCYVTRLWCEFPDGTTNGTPPRERR
jgi:hypothetical protein